MNRAFTARVLAVVRTIPVGRVATYGDVAALAGRPGAARAVGNIMRTCTLPGVPAHRVIAAGGRVGGYGGSEALKRALLMAEGIIVSGSSVRNLAAVKDRRTTVARTSQRPIAVKLPSRRRGIKKRAAGKRT
jgi:methylated-DNA-[protein]-cysteine S-methyltransferase